ncbi:MAG: amidohydrolase family protein [Planctomycetota bacterium]
MRIGSLVVLAVLSASALAQGPPHNGPRPVAPGWYALRNARIVTEPGREIARGTIVLRDGMIAAVGADVTAPAGATVVDCAGLTVYPGLIEPFVATDVPALDATTTDQHWNPMVQPQRNALDGALLAEGDRNGLRALGFAAAAVAPSGGILKGTAAVILIDEPSETDKPRVLRRAAYAVASLQTNRGGYPNSEMGAIAVLRQSLADGLWYERSQKAVTRDAALAAHAPQPSAALQAIADQRDLPLWCDTQNELQALRLLDVAAEFERRAVIVGSGMEFRRLAALREAGAAVIVPLQLPDAPDVSTAALAERTSLRQLQSWEQAPTNSFRLLDAGLEVAWTTARLKDRKEFAARVRDARQHGVTAAQALAAVTTVPARLLGVDAQLGTIAPGKLANLAVLEGELFGEKAVVRDVWVGGVRHVVSRREDAGLDGAWQLSAGWPGDTQPVLQIDGKKVKVTIGEDKLDVAEVRREPATLACRITGKPLADGEALWLRLHLEGDVVVGVATGTDGVDKALRGARAPKDAGSDDGQQQDTAKKEAAKKDGGESAAATTPTVDLGPLPTPLGGYGFVEQPAQEAFAIVGATLWPCDGRTPLRDGAVYVRGGKIVFAGPRADLPKLPDGATVIDGNGKHLTPGIIDCHSHTGISRGVNESGQAVTAEVRIQDVVDPDDVNWYRELAGGVTMVNQLHGSANAIGGQSCTTKVRWGAVRPKDMPLAGAMPGIKFALGENPRGANSREPGTRYPNTRMGVEGLIRDRFAAAEAYARERAAYEALAPAARAKVLPPRIDLELQALAEVLSGKRWIHCHSYRQDEIFMLCQLAKERGIKIGTFQHVLEGYKVADAIRDAAVGASSFSDWWAYKFEVYDAIPDNGAILHEAGVVVSFNSDSDEHARRLNTEAAKAVKYGSVAEHEALCFVTRNPAIQLGVFDRTGSLTEGKDADLALWSAHPLSYAARCESTWVDGRRMFSLERDAQLRAGIAAERQRLLRLLLSSGKHKKSRPGDPKDAYWAAEESNVDYCCRDAEGGRR